MKRIARVLVGTAVVAGVLSGGMQAQAAGLTTHKNAKLGYSIQYPSSWKKSNVPSQDLTVEPADGNALLSASVGAGVLTLAQLQKLIDNELTKLSMKAGTLKDTKVVIHGVTFVLATA